MLDQQLQDQAKDISTDLFIWHNKNVTVKNYQQWRDRGLVLLSQAFLLRKCGCRFSELEQYIMAIYGKDYATKIKEVM